MPELKNCRWNAVLFSVPNVNLQIVGPIKRKLHLNLIFHWIFAEIAESSLIFSSKGTNSWCRFSEKVYLVFYCMEILLQKKFIIFSYMKNSNISVIFIGFFLKILWYLSVHCEIFNHLSNFAKNAEFTENCKKLSGILCIELIVHSSLSLHEFIVLHTKDQFWGAKCLYYFETNLICSRMPRCKISKFVTTGLTSLRPLAKQNGCFFAQAPSLKRNSGNSPANLTLA